MNEPAPRCFGKYQLLQTLGSGAMGVVYLAYDPVISRRVALKTIRKDVLEDVPEASERFRREASAAGRLCHPGIVAVYDYGEDADVAFIVMEYVAGLALDAHAAQHCSSLPSIAGLMGELLAALGYAHAAGIVHRDVKPANILVSDRLKITDFGIARVDASSRTETGVAVGTPQYMAPEQFFGRGVDHRVDLFAAGVILYELLTGTRPFHGSSLLELSHKVCHAEFVSATRLNPKLPPSIDGVLAQALAKSKDERFASAAEFWRALSDALPGEDPPATGLRPAAASVAAHLPWSTAEVLQALEGVLVPIIGSVARIAVRRSAARASSSDELLRLLSESIEGDPARAALLGQLRVVLLAADKARTAPPAAASEADEITPDVIARVALALARFLGPIATVLTKKAALASTSYLDLCLRLSGHLRSEEEKACFLKDVGIR
jgi:serine/threonine protein kinase